MTGDDVMKIIDKIVSKKNDRSNADSVTVVCLGDSVTEGCFECYINGKGRVDTLFERSNSYSAKLQELLAKLYPTVQINVINSGKSGGTIFDGAQVLERDVLSFSPDLVVVSYGLNDSGKGVDGIDAYGEALASLIERIKARGAEIIFLTQNCMCTQISPFLTEPKLIKVAEDLMHRQNTGVLDAYFEKAREVCEKNDVPVCDLYALWKAMIIGGVDVNELLSNKLNHPMREYHSYIAVKLVETMLGI